MKKITFKVSKSDMKSGDYAIKDANGKVLGTIKVSRKRKPSKIVLILSIIALIPATVSLFLDVWLWSKILNIIIMCWPLYGIIDQIILFIFDKNMKEIKDEKVVEDMIEYNVYLDGKFMLTTKASGYSSGIVKAHEALNLPYGGQYGINGIELTKNIVTIEELKKEEVIDI